MRLMALTCCGVTLSVILFSVFTVLILVVGIEIHHHQPEDGNTQEYDLNNELFHTLCFF